MSSHEKKCFIACPIGRKSSAEREHSDYYYDHLFQPVLEMKGYQAIRPDLSPMPGVITEAILNHLWSCDLVIADLSFHNPNVFYEMALRHSFRKPIIQVIKEDERIPFDTKALYTVALSRDEETRQKCMLTLSSMVDALDSGETFSVSPFFDRIQADTLKIFIGDHRSQSRLLNVAISGAQSVGKTTLCRGVVDKLMQSETANYSVSWRREVARDLIRTGVPADAETRSDDYALYALRHLNNYRTAEPDVVTLFERSIVDVLAFARVNKNLHANWVSLLEELVELTASYIDVYFYIPIEIPLVDDGVRSTDEEYRKQLDLEVLEILQRFFPRYIEVTGTRKERAARAISVIERTLQEITEHEKA